MRPDVVPRRPPLWRRAGFRWLVSALILAALLLFLPFDELRAAFGRIPPRTWLLALPSYLALHSLGVAKWRLLVNAAGGGLSAGSAIRCYWYGLFGNTFLPSVAGGDVVRAGLATQLARSPSGVIVGSVVDRLIDVAALGVVAGVGLLFLPRSADFRANPVLWAVVGAVCMGGLALCAFAATLPLRAVPRRFRRPWVRAVRSLRTVGRRPVHLTGALMLGVALQTSLVLLNAWLGAACGLDAAPTTWLFVWPVAKLSAMLPVTQGGLGLREAALAALLAPFGVPSSLAVVAGLVFQGVVIGGGLVAGGLAFLLGRAPGRRSNP